MKLPLAFPDIGREEQRAVFEVLKTGRLSLGPYATRFEKRLARLSQRRFGVAVSSGTAALHLAVRALGLHPGDEVITTPFSFVASANCLVYEGVTPVFVDIDPLTLCLDPAKVESRISSRTRAILAVDIFGHPADWPALTKIARKYRIALIEDACEALGSSIRAARGQGNGEWPIANGAPSPVSNTPFAAKRRCGAFGDIAVFAFYPNKQITTGEGGAVVTDRARLANLCRSMANQGRRAVTSSGWLDHVRIGYNYRMDEMSAALGLVQVRRLGRILARRRSIARLYDRLLEGEVLVQRPYAAPWADVHWFVYCIRLAPGVNRDKVLTRLRDRGIGCAAYFPPIHLLPFYRERFGYCSGCCPNAETLSRQTVALPFYSRMNKQDVEFVVAELKKALKGGNR